MNHDVVAVHRRGQRGGVLDVAADDAQARIVRVVREVPLAPGAEVVVEGDAAAPPPCASRRSQKWLPMKPAPPTMKKRCPEAASDTGGDTTVTWNHG